MSDTKKTDRELMELAVKLSRDSRFEADGRVHPFVGAVIARDGVVLKTSFRGQFGEGVHAEQGALKELTDDVVAGATVYTTLEPCTTRATRMPCSQTIIDRRVRKVFIGMLDPNRDIRGQGEWKLEEHGIEVAKFDPDLVHEIRELNREFINYQLGLGVVITSPKPNDVIDKDSIAVQGIYRVRPTSGDRIRLIVRRGNSFYPQAPINWDFDREKLRWECPEAMVNAGAVSKQYEIIVARLSEDLTVATRLYHEVGRIHKDWVGLQLDPPPPGFKRLASVVIERTPRPKAP